MKITRHDEPLSTNGTPVDVNGVFPEFTVQNAKGENVSSSDLLKKVTFISVVPDINTSVCSISTKKFNQDVDKYSNIAFYTVSTNTIEEQVNWCATEGVKNMQLLSDKAFDFGKNTGLYVADNDTDARSVWVLDNDGKVLYRELVIEQTNEPDYESILQFLDSLA